jgi:hypothetical protein
LRSLTSLQASSIFSTAISRLTRSGWSSGVNFKISWKTFYWKYRFFVFGYFVCLSFSNKSPVSALKFPKKNIYWKNRFLSISCMFLFSFVYLSRSSKSHVSVEKLHANKTVCFFKLKI